MQCPPCVQQKLVFDRIAQNTIARLKVKGEDRYLYRAVDSTGQTIDFLLTAKRDKASAKRFFRRASRSTGNVRPRVINVDKNPAYPAAFNELKAEGVLSRRCRLR